MGELRSPGRGLRYDGSRTLFNLTVSEVSPSGTQPVLRTETFRNLTMSAGVPNSAVDVVNEGSRMVQVPVPPNPLGAGRPAQTGTVSDVLNSNTLSNTLAPFQFNAQLAGDIPLPVTLARAPGNLTPPPPQPLTPAQVLQDARGLLEAALRAANPNDPRYTNAIVQLIGGRFRILTGRAGDPIISGSAFDPSITITFTEQGGGTTAGNLGLFGAGVLVNVQQYSLGGTAAVFQANPVVGDNGNLPVANDIIGVRANKTGLFALEDVDIFNILCIPRAADLAAPEPFNVYSAAEVYCLERRSS